MSTGKHTRFTKEWKIGLVSTVIVLLFVWVCFFLAGKNILSSENVYYAVLDETGGVNLSAPVVVNGKKVGRVSSIEFVSGTDHRIKMGLGVKKKYKINKGSVASIESLGLMNGSGVVIYLGNDPEMCMSGDFLQGQAVPDMLAQLAPMQATIGSILTSLDSILANVNAVLDKEAVGGLRESLAALHGSMRNIESLTAHADALVKTNESRINKLVANVEGLSGVLNGRKDDLASAITNLAAISDTLAQAGIGSSMRSLKESLQQAQSLLTNINAGEGSVGKLLTDDTLYRNLEKSTHQLNLLLQDLRVNPERYVHISVFGRKEKASKKPPLE